MKFPHKPEFRVKNWLPIGRSGDWRIKRFQENNLTYTGLIYKNTWWMSDTDKDTFETEQFLSNAYGHVIITGLGLGIIPCWLAKQDKIKSITIIELNQDVIDLVWKHLEQENLKNNGCKISLIKGDARNFKTDFVFDVAWHDIWDNSRKPEAQVEIEQMKSHYQSFCKNQFFWLPYEG